MAHATEHMVEHAEHAAHGGDGFDKRVALTIAVVAAILGGVSLLSHRAHNATLQYQIQAGMKRTEAANRWAQYQSKSIRSSQYRLWLEALPVLAKVAGADAAAEGVAGRWRETVARYEDKEKDDELAGIQRAARALDKEADDLQVRSEHAHHLGDRYDIAELAVHMALVMGSIAVLTKMRGFWLAGIVLCVIGTAVAASGLAGIGLHH